MSYEGKFSYVNKDVSNTNRLSEIIGKVKGKGGDNYNINHNNNNNNNS